MKNTVHLFTRAIATVKAIPLGVILLSKVQELTTRRLHKLLETGTLNEMYQKSLIVVHIRVTPLVHSFPLSDNLCRRKDLVAGEGAMYSFNGGVGRQDVWCPTRLACEVWGARRVRRES